MSLGDMMMANEFHFASLGSGIALLNVIEPDDVQLVAGIMLASSALGWYYGLLQNEGNNFTYEDGRFTSRMVYAGGLAGFGLAAAMQVDEFKVFMLFTSAGMWGGYFYGRNNAIQEKSFLKLGFKNLTRKLFFIQCDFKECKFIETNKFANYKF